MDPVVVIICVLLAAAVVACVFYLHQRWTLCCPTCGALCNRGAKVCCHCGSIIQPPKK